VTFSFQWSSRATFCNKKAKHLSSFLFAAVAITPVILFGSIGEIVGWQYARDVELHEAEKLAQQLLRRAELAADYAVIALEELIENDVAVCGEAERRRFDAAIASKGAVKTLVRLDRDDNVTCEGSSQGAAVKQILSRGTLYPTSNPDISLMSTWPDGKATLAVLWRVSDQQKFLIVLNIDLLMFDIFSPKWRESADAAIFIESHLVAHYMPPTMARIPIFEFKANSQRYPLLVRLRVAKSGFAAWNDGAGVLGGLVGLLAGMSVSLGLWLITARKYGPAWALHEAIADDEIRPYFQPVFSLSTRQIVGCEVLVRWVKNGKVIHAPDSFIPQAERDGSIKDLTEHLIASALRKLVVQMQSAQDFKVAFNVAPQHFLDKAFTDWLINVVRELGVSAKQIVLELTERQSLDAASARRAVQYAQAAGFQVALDDTGVGHNGLANVQELGTDIIKIDKKFVDLVGVDDTATAIVTMLVGLARRLGLTTVAEGIEKESQLEELVKCGVDQGQGYLVARPMPGDDFLAFMRTRAKSLY